MSIRFFWRCESETLDATHDYSVGDTTATPIGVDLATLDSAAARIGTNGILCNSLNDHYRVDLASVQIVNRLVGAVGFWFRLSTLSQSVDLAFIRSNAASTENYVITFDTTNQRIDFFANRGAGTQSLLSGTSSVISAVDTWYFVICRWDNTANDRRIEVYDNSMSLIDGVEDTSTAWTAPSALDGSNGLRFGDTLGGMSTGTLHVDNIMIGDAYGEQLESYALYTSYTQVGAGVLSAVFYRSTPMILRL